MRRFIKKESVHTIIRTFVNSIRVVAFLLLVAVILNIWAVWFKPKRYDGALMMENFYDQAPDSIDLLFIGSSHTFIDVNTGVLWNNFGIPSYVLGGSLQPFWNSYYYLREAVKTQKPKLVVLEALACCLEYDYSEHSNIINNTSGMHWNMNKLEAIRASVSDTDGLIDYSLLFEEFHSRYDELDIFDIASNYADLRRGESWKGFYDYLRTVPQEEPVFDEDIDPVPMPAKEEFYYRMIIEFCREQEIPLLIMVSPDAAYDNHYRSLYLYAEQIAEEYDVGFIDFNEHYDDIGLNFENDFGDVGHLNHIGNRKFTSYLGNYIVQNYTLYDRRANNSPVYDSWDDNRRYIELRVMDYMLSYTFYQADYVDLLMNLSDDYEVFILISDVSFLTDELRLYLGLHEVPCQRPYDPNRYMIRNHVTTVLSADDNGLFYEEYGGEHHIAFDLTGFYYDGENVVNDVVDGISFIVYDRYNHVIADSVTFRMNEVHR